MRRSASAPDALTAVRLRLRSVDLVVLGLRLRGRFGSNLTQRHTQAIVGSARRGRLFIIFFAAVDFGDVAAGPREDQYQTRRDFPWGTTRLLKIHRSDPHHRGSEIDAAAPMAPTAGPS